MVNAKIETINLAQFRNDKTLAEYMNRAFAELEAEGKEVVNAGLTYHSAGYTAKFVVFYRYNGEAVTEEPEPEDVSAERDCMLEAMTSLAQSGALSMENSSHSYRNMERPARKL